MKENGEKGIIGMVIGAAAGILMAKQAKKHPKETAIGVATAIVFVILVILIYHWTH